MCHRQISRSTIATCLMGHHRANCYVVYLQNISVVNTVIHIMSTDAFYGLSEVFVLSGVCNIMYIYTIKKRTQSLLCNTKKQQHLHILSRYTEMYHSHPLFGPIISVAVKGSQQENTLHLLRVFPLAKSLIIWTWKTGLVMSATPAKSMVKRHIHGFKSIYSSLRRRHQNGNVFRVTGLLCGEFLGHRWIPRPKVGDAELWCFLWSPTWTIGWVNNWDAANLRRHRTHYDGTVM